jgi:hypothetical protein
MVTTNLQNQNQNRRRFDLVLCELFNKHIHGGNKNILEPIDGHYLLIERFDGATGSILIEDDDSSDDYSEDYSDDNDDSDINTIAIDCNALYNTENNNQLTKPHKIIRNYQNIIARPDYIKPEIAECLMLESQHSVAIIKTIWIKLIQRKWKKVYAEHKAVIRLRMSYSSLKTREITGRWPQSCCYLPTLYGLLSDLN